MTEVPMEVSRLGAEAVDHFLKMLADGQTEKWALMCATQTPPGTKGTDRAFQEGRLDGNWLDQLPKRQARRMVTEARKAGIDIVGKQYVSGLADKRGHLDPLAWVSDTSDVKRVAKARNLNVQGLVTHQAHEVEPKKSKPLSQAVIQELARKERAKNPDMTREQAVRNVLERHTPRWKKPK